MNEKASVSKELNARHKKILEGLLKLPENRECADCKSKPEIPKNVISLNADSCHRGPRWASVNLGIFICMQCSGIHRSLGVHISKVRSATLDTWLPEQVAFIQTMGNEKSNCYWEAELPPNYDRVGIENFIRAKYEDKRWIPRSTTSRTPVKVAEERTYESKPTSGYTVGHRRASSLGSSGENKLQPPTTKKVIPVAHKVTNQIISDSKPAPTSKADLPPSPPKVNTSPPKANTLPPLPPQVDYATDLFNMLSMDSPSVNHPESSSSDNNEWAGFQSAGATTILEKSSTAATAKPLENKARSASGIEDLFKDSPPISQPLTPQKSPGNVKNDIMSLFEKSNMVSPYAVHQQQLAYLSLQQSILMAATKTGGVPPSFPLQTNGIAGSNGSNENVPTQGWPNLGGQIPGMTPVSQNFGPSNITQLGGTKPAFPNTNYGAFPTSGLYAMGSDLPANGVVAAGGPSKRSSSPAPSISPSQPGSDFDFSSLTRGMFSKN